MGGKIWGAVFKPFLNSGFNLAILQSDKNIEYVIGKLQIWEIGSAKTVAPSFKNLPDRVSRPAALFSPISLRSFNTISSDTKVNLNLELGNFRIFSKYCWTEGNQTSRKGEAN